MTPEEIAAVDRAFIMRDVDHPYDYDSYEGDKVYLESAGATVTYVTPNKYGDNIEVCFEDRTWRVTRGYLWAVAKEVAEIIIEKAAPKLLEEVKRLQARPNFLKVHIGCSCTWDCDWDEDCLEDRKTVIVDVPADYVFRSMLNNKPLDMSDPDSYTYLFAYHTEYAQWVKEGREMYVVEGYA